MSIVRKAKKWFRCKQELHTEAPEPATTRLNPDRTMLVLEPRIMFDAAPSTTALDALALTPVSLVSFATSQISHDRLAVGGTDLSDDGRYMVFASTATDPALADPNNRSDIFLYDNQTKTTECLSKGMSGNAADGSSFDPAISGHGGYVVFSSDARNLVAHDDNFLRDIFRYDIQNKKTELVSAYSADVPTNGASSKPAINTDGRYVVFESLASNLLSPNADTAKNSTINIFRHDFQDQSTLRLGEGTSAAISGDGNNVVFASAANDLVPNDRNNSTDIFLYNVRDQTTTKVSFSVDDSIHGDTNNHSFNPDISRDGTRIVFQTDATNLDVADEADLNHASDIFLYDHHTETLSLISRNAYGSYPNAESYQPSISADGQFVAFLSRATNIDTPGVAPPDNNNAPDVFLQRAVDAQIFRISQHPNGQVANGGSFFSPKVNADGTKVAFVSTAGNLLDGISPSLGQKQIFLADSNTAPIVNTITDILPNRSGSTAFVVHWQLLRSESKQEENSLNFDHLSPQIVPSLVSFPTLAKRSLGRQDGGPTLQDVDFEVLPSIPVLPSRSTIPHLSPRDVHPVTPRIPPVAIPHQETPAQGKHTENIKAIKEQSTPGKTPKYQTPKDSHPFSPVQHPDGKNTPLEALPKKNKPEQNIPDKTGGIQQPAALLGRPEFSQQVAASADIYSDFSTATDKWLQWIRQSL